jgi:hypothetical protein
MNGRTISLGGIATGLLFALVGLAVLLDAYTSWDLSGRVLWPVLLITGGLMVLAHSRQP